MENLSPSHKVGMAEVGDVFDFLTTSAKKGAGQKLRGRIRGREPINVEADDAIVHAWGGR